MFKKLLSGYLIFFITLISGSQSDPQFFINSSLEENETNMTHFKNFSQAFDYNSSFLQFYPANLNMLSERNFVEKRIIVKDLTKIKYFYFSIKFH